MNCRRGVPRTPTAATEVPLPHVVDWFTSGGLARPLYGWNTSSLSRPGEGTQSWLFCPLISLGLRSLEINLGVVAFSTGPRAPVPDSQFQFWSHNAANIINAFAAHFAALPRDDPVALALSQSRSWGSSGAHLDAGLQEQATPPHILSMLEVWIASQVAQFQDPELPSIDPVVVDNAQPRAAPTVLPSVSPLLFNLLVDSLAAAIRSAVPGVRLMVSDPFRLVCQLYAVDLVILADSPADLQAALSAVYAWGTCWRFTFGIGPNKSAVMVFGPTRGRTPCLVHLGGVPLPMVLQYRYLGIVLTPCLSWRAHVAYLCARGDRLFHQSGAWCHGEGLPVTFALSVFIAYVLSSASFGLEYIGDDPAALLQFNLSLQRWCRQLLGWPRASPVAAVHWELGIGDALRLVYGRAFSLFGRLSAMVQNGPRSPLPSSIFRLCSNEQGTWAHWCTCAFRSLSVSHPGDFGISPGSPPSSVSRWFSREVSTRLDHDLHLRLMAMAYDLHGVRVDLATSHFSSAQHNPIYSRSLPFAWSRSWGLARWGHDPSSTGRSARHQNRPVACPLCLADDGSLAHHLSVCPCHSAARDLWAHSCGFDVTEAATWAAHPWLFNPQHEANTLQTVRAHVRFVGHVCSRLERPRW